jgi:hypothetical protein
MFSLASDNEVTKPKAAPVVDGLALLALGGWTSIAMVSGEYRYPTLASP